MGKNTEEGFWARYAADYRRRVLPGLTDSAVVLSIYPGEDPELRQATDIGFALLLDKPVVVVVPRGRTIGARLRRAADLVVEDFDPGDRAAGERLAAAVKRLAEAKE